MKNEYEIDYDPEQPECDKWVYKAICWTPPWGYMVAKCYRPEKHDFDSKEFKVIKKNLDLIIKRTLRLQKKLKKPTVSKTL